MGSSDPLFTQFDSVFFEKTRLSIITLLYKEDQVSFIRIKKIIGGTDGAIYTHLQKLEEGGYIRPQKEFVGTRGQTVYRITGEGRRTYRRYLKFMESLLAEHNA